MSNTPRRRLIDRFGGPPTFIGERTRFTGDIETAGALVLCGHVKGDGDIKGALSIARDASWQGEVRAQQAVIAGRVTGSLRVEGKLELGAGSVVQGSVSARNIAIARGAVVEGDITVTSGEPIVQFVEKRKPQDPTL